MTKKITLGVLAATAAVNGFGQGSTGAITVHIDKPGIRISPTFYGMMTEEINHAYDGGLYGELLRNRSFRDDSRSPIHWSLLQEGSATGSIKFQTGSLQGPNARNSSVKLTADSVPTGGRVGISNDGYWGIPIATRTKYDLSFRGAASGSGIVVSAAIQDSATGVTFAKSDIRVQGEGWKSYYLTLKTGDLMPTKTAKLVLSLSKPGNLELNFVSLFGPTYRNRTNGNRVDLMDKMADLKPSFLRLPGGNYLEGNKISERFDWKETLGPVEDRAGHPCPWGYRSSDGLGILEFLEWCEDLRMQPVLAVFAGYALQGSYIPAGPKLAPFVQDALDELEFVTGDIGSKWGSVRASLGHPKPFPLTYVEIGNEDMFDRSGSYEGRFGQFYDAIKKNYPKLKLIATLPVKSRRPDVIDDHYYRSPAEMSRDSGHYDRYDRKEPKIFVGEWASMDGNPTPTHSAALGDAAWLTGLERDSDVVVMEAYAPLFVNINPGASQWPTNLIGYDALNSFASPSFYVQSMFGKNTGDRVLPSEVSVPTDPSPSYAAHGGIGLGTYRTQAEYKDVEVTKNGQMLYQKNFTHGIDDWKLGRGSWQTEGNVLRQTGNGPDTSAISGDEGWTDYTYHVKARKISGSEGFMILFDVHDRRNNWRWNIGGWQNSRSSIQRTEDGSADEVGPSTNVTIESGRWYDIKIEIVGNHVKCFLDDKLITEIDETAKPPVQPIYVAASHDRRSGEVILKVVNVGSSDRDLAINLEGSKKVAEKARAWVMVGKPSDSNSIASPRKVAPVELTIDGVAPSFRHTFPAYSVSVIRFRCR